MQSIQSRLSSGLLVSLLTIFISLWALVGNSIQELAESYTASRLYHDIETIVSAIDFDKQGNIKINHERINPIYKQPFSGHYYSIQYQQHQLRSRSLWDQKLDLDNILVGKNSYSYQKGPESQPLIVVSDSFNKNEYQFYISVAEDLTPLMSIIEQFKNKFALISAIALIILLIIQFFILRQGLKPLQHIKEELAELDQGKINQLSKHVLDELKPLVNEINHLLDISQKRLKRSRDALTDLSHAIKKPLTVMIQLTHASITKIDQRSLNILHNQVQDIQQLTDRILKRGRLSGNLPSGALFDFNNDLSLLIKTIEMMYPNKNLLIKYNIDQAIEQQFDREDMLELFGNLVDNAYKWAQNSIHITINQSSTINIIIEDDGPGSETASLNKLAKRGVRLDETTSGYGFGLAITADIISDYEGKLSFDRSELLAGFMVCIELPLENSKT